MGQGGAQGEIMCSTAFTNTPFQIPLKIRLKFSNKSVWVCFWISSGESWRMSLPLEEKLTEPRLSAAHLKQGCCGSGWEAGATGPGRGRRDRSNLCAQPFPIPCPGSTASKTTVSNKRNSSSSPVPGRSRNPKRLVAFSPPLLRGAERPHMDTD